MKRLQPTMPSRPVSSSGRVARSKKEAAIQLVRIEFDISRLEAAIAQAQQRSNAHSAELDIKAQQRAALMQILND